MPRSKHRGDGSHGFILQLTADLLSRRIPVTLPDLIAKHECSRATIHRAVVLIERYFPDRIEYVHGDTGENPGFIVPRRWR